MGFEFFNIFDGLDDVLNAGDPTLREWFLVKSKFWPTFLCCVYWLTVKVIGPAFMKNREPFELRKTMIVYNLFVVVTYTSCVSVSLNCLMYIPSSSMCENLNMASNSYYYTIGTCGWIIYMLKYVEFLDTVFFVLRKKDKLVTNLHVIHHFLLPLIGWMIFRTERSGFQGFPILINSVVHIVMYSYYGLAAMGPNVRKYLWWKRYLTIAQMVQFILIIVLEMIVMPFYGCASSATILYINILAPVLFFVLFFNFYKNTFEPKSLQDTEINGQNNCTFQDDYKKK